MKEILKLIMEELSPIQQFLPLAHSLSLPAWQHQSLLQQQHRQQTHLQLTEAKDSKLPFHPSSHTMEWRPLIFNYGLEQSPGICILPMQESAMCSLISEMTQKERRYGMTTKKKESTCLEWSERWKYG